MRPFLNSRHRRQAQLQIVSDLQSARETEEREAARAARVEARAAARAERRKWAGLPPIGGPFGPVAFARWRWGHEQESWTEAGADPQVIARMFLRAALVRFQQAHRLVGEAQVRARKRAEQSAKQAIDVLGRIC